MKYLSAILRFFNENDYTHREDVAIIISDIYEQNSGITVEDFKVKIKGIRSDFFRINRIDREQFAESVFDILKKTEERLKEKVIGFDVARSFISQFLEIGYEKVKYTRDRNAIVAKFGNVTKPHSRLVESFNSLLQKITQTYQISLHGVKEYSGVDLVKRVGQAIIGFQVKTVNDNISEDKIRAQTSKALEYHIDGFVWIYGRPPSKEVESSIQAAYHHFKRINETKKMYCALISPELLAELFRQYRIEL